MKKVIIGNWKMNGSHALVDALAAQITPAAELPYTGLVCPPFTLLAYARKTLPASLFVGAQDIAACEKGAFTGDVSGALLADSGATHVLIGHSERRLYHQENETTFSEKIQAALAQGLLPILCVGESHECFDKKETKSFLRAQLHFALPFLKEKAITLAYEPLWAIGTGQTPTLPMIQDVHSFLEGEFGVAPFYGGSVTIQNYQDILALGAVGGLLIGGESLFPEKFALILQGKAL
ncbi:triosephosphate isomerase [Alphaproteobacteria bacterium]|nr:triosephosphate isomerase [Alphaproteobacteria bacterium]GHS95910.1 triosephosphate isomerase [Alphaproteobacteria bacterium]